jgi:hypothetical protein
MRLTPSSGLALTAVLSAALALGCGDSLESHGGESATPSAAEVSRWPSAWCSVQPGGTRDELIAAMGAPTSESPEAARWQAFGWQLNAFFDEGGTVSQMDINEIGLTPTQRAKITCETTRTAY